MADSTPQTSNADKVAAKIATIKAHLQIFVGKPGFNPYQWISDNLKPLEKEAEKTVGVITDELLKKYLALPDAPQPLAKGAEHNAKNPPPEVNASGKADTRPIPSNISSGNNTLA